MLRLRRSSVCPEKWQHWVCLSSSWGSELDRCCWDLFRKSKTPNIDNVLTRYQRVLWSSSHISRLLFHVHHLDHPLSRCPKYSNNAHSTLLRRSVGIRISLRSWRYSWWYVQPADTSIANADLHRFSLHRAIDRSSHWRFHQPIHIMEMDVLCSANLVRRQLMHDSSIRSGVIPSCPIEKQSSQASKRDRWWAVESSNGEDEQVDPKDHCVLASSTSSTTHLRAHGTQSLLVLSDLTRDTLFILRGFRNCFSRQSWVQFVTNRSFVPRDLRRYDTRSMYRPIFPQELREINQAARRCHRWSGWKRAWISTAASHRRRSARTCRFVHVRMDNLFVRPLDRAYHWLYYFWHGVSQAHFISNRWFSSSIKHVSSLYCFETGYWSAAWCERHRLERLSGVLYLHLDPQPGVSRPCSALDFLPHSLVWLGNQSISCISHVHTWCSMHVPSYRPRKKWHQVAMANEWAGHY